MRMSGVAGLVFVATGPMVLAQAGPGVCFRSPEDVVRGGPLAQARDTGYRLQSTRWDALLQRGWATVVSCDHPERPGITVAMVDPAREALATALPASIAAPGTAVVARPVSVVRGPTVPVVRAGDVVHVFRNEEMAQIEFSGVAQANGNPGDVIRVRIKHAVSDEPIQDQYIAAVVRGPRLLEMQP